MDRHRAPADRKDLLTTTFRSEAAFPDHPETLSTEDLSVLRELFGAPLFTPAYPLTGLPIIEEL